MTPDVVPPPDYTVVATDAQLASLATDLAAADAIGLDTEFLRERTYRAELCLVQAATRAQIACVDPLALASLAPLRSVLGVGGPLKILHAARQDLEVLAPTVGVVAPLFDTQIAASLAGFPAQVGYAELVRQLLGTGLAKAHTRCDWSRRPLSRGELAYACDDVRYLIPLREALLERLASLGRIPWLDEELVALTDPATYTVNPEDAWRRLKGFVGLDEGRQRLLRALAAWRERRAIDRNRPRGWILDDPSLKEIVLRVPRSPEDLRRIEGLPEGVVKHSGRELLALVGEAAIADPAPPLARRARPDPQFTAALNKLSSIAKASAAELGLSAEVLATRRDLERLASGDRAGPLMSGWRRSVIGERLLQSL
jgi:ribonuclease D